MYKIKSAKTMNELSNNNYTAKDLRKK